MAITRKTFVVLAFIFLYFAFQYSDAQNNRSPSRLNGTKHVAVHRGRLPETHLQRSLLTRLILGSVFLLLSIIGFVGNLAVIFVIFTDPNLKIKNQISNITIVNLAITDVITTGLACSPGAIAVIFDVRDLPHIVCLVQAACNLGMMECSLNTMLVITIDRFVAVTWPLHYPQMMNEKKLIIMCYLAWLTAINAGPGSVLSKGGSWIGFDYASGVCDILWLTKPDAFWWVAYNYFVCMVPVIPIVVMNVSIVKKSRNKGPAAAAKAAALKAAGTNKTAAQLAKEKHEAIADSKIMKSMMLVVVAFFVLSCPITGIRFTKSLLSYIEYPADDFPIELTMAFVILQILASVVNPLIYGMFRKDFRDAFKKLFKVT